MPLSFTLYLPPGYKQGTRLPTVVWAYPLEYTDAGTAGQVAGSTNRFTTIAGDVAPVLPAAATRCSTTPRCRSSATRDA